MTVLVTGSKGMIGSHLVKGLLAAGLRVVGVDRVADPFISENYRSYITDLTDKSKLESIIQENEVDRMIHLAALAHSVDGKKFSWDDYKAANFDCAQNLFDVAGDRPVLFISTVDVFGFYDGKQAVTGTSPIKPISHYGKSKAMAEEECKKLKHYTIFRFSPVYSDTIKRDIQKRYYLRYPKIAYLVGKGTGFEVLNIDGAVAAMVDWCFEEPGNDIRIIKDDKLLWTPDYIKVEKEAGRASMVIHLPRWIVNGGYAFLKAILGENEKTYLLNKAIHPLRSKSEGKQNG